MLVVSLKSNILYMKQILDYPPLDIHTDPFLKPMPKKAISPKMPTMFNACYVETEKLTTLMFLPCSLRRRSWRDSHPHWLLSQDWIRCMTTGVDYANMLKSVGVHVELHDVKTQRTALHITHRCKRNERISFLLFFTKII